MVTVTNQLLCSLQVRPKQSCSKQRRNLRPSAFCRRLCLSRWTPLWVFLIRSYSVVDFCSFWSVFFFCILQNGNAAASLTVAEQYVSAFSNLAKESNTILLPTNAGDMSSMVTQVFLAWISISNCLCCFRSPQSWRCFPILCSGHGHLQHVGKDEPESGARNVGGEDRKPWEPIATTAITEDFTNELKAEI